MKLTFLDKQFKQNAGNTVAIITCRLHVGDIYLDYKKYYDLPKIFKASWSEIGNDLEFKCFGVAKCCVDDAEKYDPVLGRHIAETKAKQKAYSKAERILRYYLKAYQQTTKDLSDSVTRMHDLHAYELAHMEKLTK